MREVLAAAPRGRAELEAVRSWRDRQAFKTAGAGLIVQALGYAARLAVIPLSLRLLGAEAYGLWLAVGSLVAWGGVADLGFSPGLVNVVAGAFGRGDQEGARRYISTAFAAYMVLAGALVLVALLVSQWPGLPGLLGARNPELGAQARLLVAVCGAIFAATSLTRVIPTACTALQEGYHGAWAHLAGSLASLALLAPLLWAGGALLSYALVMALPSLAAQVGLGVYFFGRRHPELRPGLRWCDAASLRALWGVGAPLTLHQLANLMILYSANILIANRLGAAAVPQYSVPYALFAVLISTTWLIVSPYLPTYAEASARGDWQWIRRRAVHALGVTGVLVAGGGAVLVLAGPEAIRLWTGGQVKPAPALLATLACFSLLRALTNTNGVLLVGLGLVRFAALVSVTVATLYVAGAWLLLPRLGLLAVPISGGVACLLEAGISVPYGLRRVRAGAVSVPQPSPTTTSNSIVLTGATGSSPV